MWSSHGGKDFAAIGTALSETGYRFGALVIDAVHFVPQSRPRLFKSANTTPELFVRRLTHRMGYRFRLHRKDLPGKLDLVFPALHKAIFVHGCFWHGHYHLYGNQRSDVRRWLIFGVTKPYTANQRLGTALQGTGAILNNESTSPGWSSLWHAA